MSFINNSDVVTVRYAVPSYQIKKQIIRACGDDFVLPQEALADKLLPDIHLSAKNGKLILLDWYSHKTQKLLGHMPMITPNEQLTGENGAVLRQASTQLDEYFAGIRQQFTIPLDLSHASAFSQQVWQALMKIEYGQSICYSQLATNIGKPKAFRACANANGKNPISLIIPCHRVIAKDGGIGGYTGGTWIKRILLGIEGVDLG